MFFFFFVEEGVGGVVYGVRRRPAQLSPSGGGCWSREAPHEFAGKRPQGAGAHVNEETAAAAPASQRTPPPPPLNLH